MDPAVHPVHKAGDADGHPVHGELHRGQVLPGAEAQLEGDGAELGGGQLLRHIVHHRLHRPEQPAEQIAEALRLVLQPAQLLLHIPVHRGPGQLPQAAASLRPGHRVGKTGQNGLPEHLIPEDVFQNIVNKGPVLRCCKASRLAGLRLEAIAHEIGKMAGLVLVHPGGRHGHLPPVQLVHRQPGQPAPAPARRPVQPLHHGGILRQGGQSPPGRRTPPRLLQGGQRCLQTERTAGVLLPRHPQIGEQPPQPLHQKAGAALLPGGALAGPADHQPLRRPCAGEVHRGHLPVEQLLGGLSQLQAVARQNRAVLVGQQPRGAARLGDGDVVRPQQEEHLHRMPRLPGGLPHRHPVQGHRDGAHIVLGEHQAEQAGELLQLHGGLPQKGGALLQAPAQDLPQLPVLLRQGGLVPAVELRHPVLQPLGQADLLHKAVKADRLPHPGPVLIFPQKLQRLRHLAAGPVQPLQQRPVLIGDGGPIPPGGHGPGLFLGPLAPPEVPFQHIVLQQVPVLLRQIGESGLEIAEHIVIAVAVGHRVQRRRHQGEDGLVQDVRHGGGEHRDLIAGEDGLDQRLIDRQVPGRHPDVPAAQALGPQQAADPSGRLLHL